ncbi:MAG: hypothetical protein KDD42_03045 [Bdellovibrionales bacterium]|nr:hypothetical protein [Bdellovibrionales bacterium]
MSANSIEKLPRKVQVKDLVTSRYLNGARPSNWDERSAGEDIVITTEGETLKLWSDGGQSPPQPGWILMLRDKRADSLFGWTLYGMPRESVSRQ